LLKQIISFADKQSVLLECWFYCYAHTKKWRIQKTKSIYYKKSY
jgi:hypothetical protein